MQPQANAFFVLEDQAILLDNTGEPLELFRPTSKDYYLPVHRHTIPKNSITKSC